LQPAEAISISICSRRCHHTVIARRQSIRIQIRSHATSTQTILDKEDISWLLAFSYVYASTTIGLNTPTAQSSQFSSPPSHVSSDCDKHCLHCSNGSFSTFSHSLQSSKKLFLQSTWDGVESSHAGRLHTSAIFAKNSRLSTRPMRTGKECTWQIRTWK
jgi:hypothetical protein